MVVVLGSLTIAILAVIVIVPRLVNATLSDVGRVILAVGLVTVSWNAVTVSGFQLGDIALAVALPLLLVHGRVTGSLPTLPAPVLLGSALIALAGGITAVFPTNIHYLAGRFVSDPYFHNGNQVVTGGDLTQLGKFLVALIAIPLAIALAAKTVRHYGLLADCWAVGIVVSAFVAILDSLHVTHISVQLLGSMDISGREAGLTVQPNHLSVSLVLCLPVLCSWLFRSHRWRLVGWPALSILLYGVYLSGSRGGVVGAAFALAFYAAFNADMRRVLRRFAVLVVIALGVAATQVFALVTQVSQYSRLTGGADASNLERLNLRQQGTADFLHSPLHGIGFSYITSAHEVHVQLLAAGGLLAVVGFAVYMTGVVRRFRPAIAVDRLLGGALAATIITWLALNFVENQLTDRYLFVPVGLVLATAARRPRPAIADSQSQRRLVHASGPAHDTGF